MVKHAANGQHAAADRRGAGRTRPLHGVTAGQTFTDEQQQWLDRIRAPPGREPVDRPGGLRDDAGLCPRMAAGAGRTSVFDGQAAQTASHDLNESYCRMTRRRSKTLGLLPHPAPRRHRLRRLHRAAHLPAVPQDGRRARHRRCPRGCDWPTLRDYEPAPT